jgi:ABC-type lipoprotein release transport system permease subunit
MQFLIKEFRRHLFRTATSITGYFIASLFIILILSVSGTNEKKSFGILKGTGTHFIAYIPSKGSCCESATASGSLFADGVYTQMLSSDLIDSVKAIKGVRDAAPYLLYQIYDSVYKAQVSLGGIDTSSIATSTNVCAATNVIAGKFISSSPDEIVAEESFAQAHHLSLGDTLAIFDGKFVLAGIINSGIKPGKADFYSSIESVRKILRDDLNCASPEFTMNIILVEVADARNQPEVISQLKKQMSYFSISTYNCYEPATKVMSISTRTTAVLSIMIFIFLLVFSAKTQLTALRERYRELGILKSLGWSNEKLSNQLILFSLLQSLIGACIGIVLAILVIAIINQFNFKISDSVELNFQYSSIPFVILLSVTGCLLAAVFPVFKIHNSKAGDLINDYL